VPSDKGGGILAGTRTYTNIPAEGIPGKGHWMRLMGCVGGLETKWKAFKSTGNSYKTAH